MVPRCRQDRVRAATEEESLSLDRERRSEASLGLVMPMPKFLPSGDLDQSEPEKMGLGSSEDGNRSQALDLMGR